VSGWRAAGLRQLASIVGAIINMISYPTDIQEATTDLLFLFGLNR
jgi:type III secretory pathway component EscS